MDFLWKPFSLIPLLFLSCDTGKLDLIASLNNSLDESSGLEVLAGSKLFWTIEDAGNDNHIYGVDHKGNIVKDVTIKNSKNKDWEELTSDGKSYIYIGDFGNNNRKRKQFEIYKVPVSDKMPNEVTAEIIRFKLPKGTKSEDFEAFFLFEDQFYIFSKEQKSGLLLSVPNIVGKHTAKVISKFDLKGKHNRITSAAISPNKKTIVLLNHDKLWKITDFKPDYFFDGKLETIPFHHSSQKEGICFWDNDTVLISDERNGPTGGNIYKFKIDMN